MSDISFYFSKPQSLWQLISNQNSEEVSLQYPLKDTVLSFFSKDGFDRVLLKLFTHFAKSLIILYYQTGEMDL
jgi:hypothetical protein